MKAVSLDPRRWSLAFKAPLIVAAFMLVVSIVMTNAVLSRLRETQERHLAVTSAIYLNGLAAALIPHVLRDDIWEIFDTVDRGAAMEGNFGRATIVVVDGKGATLAASDPKQAPVSSRQDDRERSFLSGADLIVDTEKARAFARRPLVHQDRRIGAIYVDYDVSHLLRERAEAFRTLAGTNAAIALLLAAVGYWIIRRMMGPLRTLSRHLDLGVAGAVQPIASGEIARATHEFGRLFRRFNIMAEAVNDREAIAKELANEERLASLGRLASGMAHEINNPLGGLFNAIDTLKRHGDKPSIRKSSLDLVERGLTGIRDVVRSALTVYRADRNPRDLAPADLDDLKLLIRPEIDRRTLKLVWRNHLDSGLPLPATAVRQVVLNLLLNAVQVAPPGSPVRFDAAVVERDLIIEVQDKGPGFDEDARSVLTGEVDLAPTVHSGLGAGLGLWMTHRLVQDLGGHAFVHTQPDGGSIVRVVIPLKPNGSG